MSSRDLDAWQLALNLVEADLREREHRELEGQLTAQEHVAFAAERDKLATDRDALADARDDEARGRDAVALGRDVAGSRRDRAARARADDHDPGFADRFNAGADRDLAAGDRSDAVDDRHRAATARGAAADDRQRAADDRRAAAGREEHVQRELDTLRDALDTRVQIGQAQGLLMARYALNTEEAFRLLVKLSQETHIKLREVAARLVADAESEVR